MPQEKPSTLPRVVAKRNARIEALEAFERWHLERGGALHAATKNWCALYREAGAGVSAETRTVIRSLSWSTLRRWRNLWQKGGDEALQPAKGGRKSTIGADPDMRAAVEEMLSAGPANVPARDILEVLAAQLPEKPQPGIASVRRFVRRWREERSGGGGGMDRDERWKARLIRNQEEQIRILEDEEIPGLTDDLKQCLIVVSRAMLESLEEDAEVSED